MSQTCCPPTPGTTQHREVRALVPASSPSPPHGLSSTRDWAVSMGSHMQQDMDISVATQRPSILFCLGGSLTLDHHMARISPRHTSRKCAFLARGSRPVGRLTVTEKPSVHSHGTLFAFDSHTQWSGAGTQKLFETQRGVKSTPLNISKNFFGGKQFLCGAQYLY